MRVQKIYKACSFLALAALSSCATYERSPIDHQSMVNDSENLSLSQEHVDLALKRLESSGILAGQNITFRFEDGLTFTEAFALSLALNPTLKIDRESIKVQEGLMQSVSGIGKITLSAQDSGHDSDNRRGESSLMFDMKAMFGLGQRQALVEMADASLLATRLRLHQSQWELHSTIRQLFDELIATRGELEDVIALHDAYVKKLVPTAKVLKNARRLNNDTWSEHVEFFNEVNIHLVNLTTQKSILESKIFEQIGLPPGFETYIHLDKELERKEIAHNVTRLKNLALKRRPDLQVLLAEYEISEAALRRAIASQYPDFYLGPNFRFGPGSDIFGGALSVSFTDSDKANGDIKAAMARRETIRYKTEIKLLNLSHSLKNSIEALRTANRNVTRWQENVLPAVSNKLEISMVRLKKNPKELSSSIRAFSNNLKAIRDNRRYILNRLKAYLALERTAGFPLNSESAF